MNYAIIGPLSNTINRGGHYRAAAELQAVLGCPVVPSADDVPVGTDVVISVYNLDITKYPSSTPYRRVVWGPIDVDDYATKHALANVYPYVDVYIPMTTYQYSMALQYNIRVTPPLHPPYRRIHDVARRKIWRDGMCIGDDTVVYVAVGDKDHRKHITMIIDAYLSLRERRKRTFLILVSRGLQHIVPRDFDIYICGHGVDDIDQVYLGGDVFVSASGGEGWGYPAWDAAHSGMRLVLPCHTAYRDLYMYYSRIHYITKYRPMYNLHDDRRYYVPDIDALIDCMTDAYDAHVQDATFRNRIRAVDAFVYTTPDIHADFERDVRKLLTIVERR